MGTAVALLVFVLVAGCGGDKDCAMRCDADGANCTSDCPDTK
jgi:hypothetical protein